MESRTHPMTKLLDAVMACLLKGQRIRQETMKTSHSNAGSGDDGRQRRLYGLQAAKCRVDAGGRRRDCFFRSEARSNGKRKRCARKSKQDGTEESKSSTGRSEGGRGGSISGRGRGGATAPATAPPAAATPTRVTRSRARNTGTAVQGTSLDDLARIERENK